jgi:uncharacterized protein YndB with AHSA1/START domain
VSITDRTDTSQTETLWFDFELEYPPEKVWRTLTEPDLLRQWLLPVFDLELEPGVVFTFRSEPMPEWDGIVHCRILEIDEPVRLSYAWVVGDMDTVVTFTLTPTDSGTRMSLVHSGFREDQKRNWGGARYGWKMMGGRLVELLATTGQEVR